LTCMLVFPVSQAGVSHDYLAPQPGQARKEHS
jgi:hypothetical protein